MPASIQSSSTASTTSTTTNWRKCGQRLRAALIEQDDAQQQFCLSDDCPIERYYKVADKVLDQFLNHPIDTRDELLEAYMVGHRLVQFLSRILPTHGAYHDDDGAQRQARDRSQEQLVQVLRYLDQMAVLIDKQEHEEYIRSVLGEEEMEDRRARMLKNEDSSTPNSSQVVDTSMASLLQGTATVPELIPNDNTRWTTTSKKNSSSPNTATIAAATTTTTAASTSQHRLKPPSPTKSSLRSNSGSNHRSNNVRWQKQPPQPPQPQSPLNRARSLPWSSSTAPSHSKPLPQQRATNQHHRPLPQQQQPSTLKSVDDSRRNNRMVVTVPHPRSSLREPAPGSNADDLDESHESHVRAMAKNWPPQRNAAAAPTAPPPRHSETKQHRPQRQEPQQPMPQKKKSVDFQFQSSRDVFPPQLMVEPKSRHPPLHVKVSAEQRDTGPTTSHFPGAGMDLKKGHESRSPVTLSAEQSSPEPSSSQGIIVATEDTTKAQPVNGIGDAKMFHDDRKTRISVESSRSIDSNGVSLDRHRDETLSQNTTSAAATTWEEAYARNLPDSIGCSSSEDENEQGDDDSNPELVPNDEISVSSSEFQREESVASSQRTSIAGRKTEVREQVPVTSKSEDEAWTSFSKSQPHEHEQAPGLMRELSLSNASSEFSVGPSKRALSSLPSPVVSISASCDSEASAQQLLKQESHFPSSPRVENMISHDSSSTGQYFLPYDNLSSRNSFQRDDVSFDSVDFEETASRGAHFPPAVTPTDGKRSLRQTVSKGDEQLDRANAIARREGVLSRLRQSEPCARGAVTSLEPHRVVSPETILPAPCSDVALVTGYSASALDWSRIDEQSVTSRNSHQKMQSNLNAAAVPALDAAGNLNDTSGGDFYFSSQFGGNKFSTLASPIRSTEIPLGLVTDPEPGSWQQAWVSSPGSHSSSAIPNSLQMPSLSDCVIRPVALNGDTKIECHGRSELKVKSQKNTSKAQSATISSFKKPSPVIKSSSNLKSTDTTTTRSTSTIGSHLSESRTAPIGTGHSTVPVSTLDIDDPVSEMDSKWDNLKFAYYRGSANDDALFSREPKPCLLICGRKNMENERSPNEHLDTDDDSSLQLLKPNRRSHFRSCVRFLLD